MSKNYELLQQAEFGLGVTPTVATGEDIAARDSAPSTSQALSCLEPTVREEAQKLVQRLFFASDKITPKAVVFAGVDASIGCNWLSVLTAKVLAKSVPGSVCLVEGNLRSPALGSALGVNGDRGLVDSLRQDGSIREFTKQIGTDRLWFLPSGDPVQDSLTLLNSDRMKERVAELRREFDYLVMNAPPMNAFADGMAIGQLVDGVILVLEANATRREAALRVTESLRTTKIPILGAVLNNRTFPIPEAVYKRL
jgi:Mrp family chromosome partitioning ATPase